METNRNINIISWNANGLGAHDAQIKAYIKESTNDTEIICVQESKFGPETMFKIDGYNMEEKSRKGPGRGGGVATFIKQGMAYSRNREIVTDEIEAVVTGVQTEGRKTINVVNIYIPPNIEIKNEDIAKLFNLSNTIIVGDLNAKNTL